MADDGAGAPVAPDAPDASVAADASAEAPPPAFKSRSSSRGGNIRRRKAAAAATDSEDEDEGVAVAKKVRQEAQGLRIAGGTSSSKNKDAGGGDDEQQQQQTTTTTGARFVSDRKLQESGDALATATLETETEFDRDARAIRAAVLTNALEDQKRGDGSNSTANDDNDKSIYRGARNYSDHNAGFRRNLDAATAAAGGGKAAGSHGPLRASVHARMSVRFDYQPDICKDYKETGYCGFGDACKFLHDRGDHKSGWQIDREWEAKQKKEAEDKKKREDGIFVDSDGGEEGEEGKGGEDKDDAGLPFACLSCKRPWATGNAGEKREEVAADPVVTRCGHHFCEACALKNAASDPKCPVCGKAHGGTFNVAREIVRKLARGGRGG